MLLAIGGQDGKGILTVQGDEDIVAVSFLDGEIVTADALNETVEEGLGRVLQSRGLVDAESFRVPPPPSTRAAPRAVSATCCCSAA